jgi:hypothetical protein
MLWLSNCPNNVYRQEPFVKQAIIKLGDYKNRIKTWESLGLKPGDSFYKPGMLREFSLSQFTFKTLAQYVSWEKSVTRMKEKYGQSLEMFFLGDEGNLNFENMVKQIDKLIEQGASDPLEFFDPHDHKQRDKTVDHPGFNSFNQLKEKLGGKDVKDSDEMDLTDLF